MPRIATLAAAALLALPLPARAAADLRACYAAALRQSETYAQRGEDIAQAEERFRQGLAALAPSLGLSYTYLRQDPSGYPPAQQSGNPDTQNLSRASFSLPLFRGFAEYQALARAKDSLAAAREARRWAGQQLYQDLAQAYFLVLSLERTRGLLQEQVGLYGERIRELRAFQSIGRSRPSDVLSVEAAQALLKAGAVQLGAQVAAARQLLAFLTGLEPGQELAGAEPLPEAPGDLAELLEQAARRPDVAAAALRTRAAGEAAAAARAGHLPSLDLSGNAYFQRPGSSSGIRWDAALTATLPLFQGFGVVFKTAEAESLRRQAQQDESRQRRQAASEVRSLHATLAGDLEQVQALARAFELSDRSYRALRADYARGLCTNLELLQSLASSREAQRSLEAARYAARTNQARLLAAAGRIALPGDAHDAR